MNKHDLNNVGEWWYRFTTRLRMGEYNDSIARIGTAVAVIVSIWLLGA